MEKDFVIDKIKWHTQRVRNYEFDNSLVYRYFKALFVFLDENNLSTNQLSLKEIIEDTEIKKSDLNDIGFELVKVAHGNWIDKIFDKGKSPEDVRYLEKKLKEIRAKKTIGGI
jgi:hypothetical protein